MHANGTLPPTPSSHPYPHPNSPSIPFPPFIHTPAMVTPPAQAKFLAPNTFDDIENDNEMEMEIEIEMSNENELQNHENGTDEKDNRQNKEPLEHEKQNYHDPVWRGMRSLGMQKRVCVPWEWEGCVCVPWECERTFAFPESAER